MNEPNFNNISLKAHARLVEPKGKLVGFASVIVGDGLVIDNFRILNGKNGMYVGMPGYLGKDKKPHDVCRPITKDFYAQLQTTVLDAYAAQKEKARTAGEVKRETPSIMDRLTAGKDRAPAVNTAPAMPAPGRASGVAL